MKIASYNVNSIRMRLPLVLDWLKEAQPNALCVQETKVQDAEFPAGAFEQSGYKCVYKGQKGYNGVAIFSKTEPKNVSFGLDDEPKDEARFIKAEINGVIVVNTYVPQGNSPESEKFQYKLDWFKRLAKFFNKHFKPSDPVVWLGDLNIAPEPIDVYDPKTLLGHVCFHPEVHKELQEVMKWGFADVFRMHCKEAGQYTFWDFRLPNVIKRNLGWRIDHIMATKDLAEKSTACYIDKNPRMEEKPSDHTPIVAEFNW